MVALSGAVINTVSFPGVVVHELAHYLACRLVGVAVYEVCYFRFGSPGGYVTHEPTSKWLHTVVVSTAPLVLNTVVGAVVAFPSILRVFDFTGAASTVDRILVWFGVSVAMHAIPSRADAGLIWQSVQGAQASWAAKLVAAPIVGLIHVLALASMVWFDVVYGILVSLAVPKLLVALLA